MCSFCGKSGHTGDTCYKKHEYPLYLQQKYGVVNYITAKEDSDELSGDISSQSEVCDNLEFIFALGRSRLCWLYFNNMKHSILIVLIKLP